MTTPPATAPAGPTGDTHLGGSLGWSLAALLREWSASVTATCAELPHGSRGYQVLAAAVHDAPPTQAALAARLGIDRTVMTYLLDDLVAQGLVERRQDPADRRVRRVVATDRGRTVLADLDARVHAAEDGLLASLAPAERDDLRRLLHHAATGAAPDDDRCAVVGRTLT
ncbi:DNA-binding MarR family transcriptional regulator [Isoptericola jiangsuensis]|uniref:DNA-binding MarR family transcriptional regulator n=1 Tax=Isoptericola jiangsuensis TaxID=548579 RepID=A0A2A9ETH0_9MICO|nr:MarR family winged helix-turn-helix transcriptional regulator [Isoptericola jiangsuensis]PFG42043.1 DNA-binding MarR family transcriptional regulator [Isoptericola jiangsuensis]